MAHIEPTFKNIGSSCVRVQWPGLAAGDTADPADMVLLVEARSVDDVLPTASYTAPDNATIGAIAGYVDTEVGAIKAKTDQLTFTVAGQVDANVQHVNDIPVTGDGQPGTEWGPA